MELRPLRPVLLALGLAPTAAGAQSDFAGRYTARVEFGEVVLLTLVAETPDRYTGSWLDGQIAYELTAALEGGRLVGRLFLEDVLLHFTGQLEGNDLVAIVAEFDYGGRPDPYRSRRYHFQRDPASGGNLGFPPREGGNPLRSGDPLGLRNPLTPIPVDDPEAYAGRYAAGGVVLELQGTAGEYAGYLTVQGRRFPIEASVVEGVLHGTFASALNTFTFTAYRDRLRLVLESEGWTYYLHYRGEVGERPSARQPPTGGYSDDDARQWTQRIEGRGLRPTGRGSTPPIALCPNGQLRGADPSTNVRGRWTVRPGFQTPMLELWFENGTSDRYELTVRRGEVLVAGVPALVDLAPSTCRGWSGRHFSTNRK